ncbi:MAG: CBS domain-containing protein [Candidatus Kerfeldbacteria bacterium]|nr:CBS domain-containing protein [Candidatus Kerfeldbacteria bacterium]
MLISDIYHANVITIHEDTTIEEVLKALVHHHFNGFIVVNDREEVVGLISVQDIAAATVPEQFRDNVNMAQAMYKRHFFSESCQELKHQKVKEIMRTDFLTVNLETNIMAVTADFLNNDLYVVPVVENGKLLGVVTRSEIKAALCDAMGIVHHFGKNSIE